MRTTSPVPALLAAALMVIAATARGEEATIRKVLAERIPNLPKIDEVSRTPIAGLWEVRMGTDIIYTDAAGAYVVQGSLIDTKTRTNLTDARIDKLLAIDFGSLQLKDAVPIKQGNGTRRLVVFGDPHCGYCKRLEADLAKLKDVTIYTFIYPVLGPESTALARDLWCTKDPGRAWRDWMLGSKEPPKAGAKCDTAALERNLELGRKHKVRGTPAIVFEDGSRVPGVMPLDQIEARLVPARKS